MKKLNFYSITLMIIFSFALFIGGSIWTGYWQTERAATPKTIQAGSFQGAYDPYDIRGSYTIAELLEFYPVSKDELYSGLGLPISLPTSTQLKEFETLIEGEEHFGVSDVRDFVAFKMGLIDEIPTVSDHEEEISQAVVTIPESGSETALGDGAGIGSSSGLGDPTDPTIDHTERSATTPTGRTTLAQVYAWGITQEMLENEFHTDFSKIGATPSTILKDLADQLGLKMFDLKEFITNNM